MSAKAAMTPCETLQHHIRTDWWQYGAPPATFDKVLNREDPCLQWPYKTKPPAFIKQQIDPNGRAFLKLPPMLYIVSFQCTTAINMLRHAVETLQVEIDAEYAVVTANGATVGTTTPLGWLLYVTSWHPENYHGHTPMLTELLRLGADTNAPVMTDFNAPVMTDFNARCLRSPLCAALDRQPDGSMTFAKLLMHYGASFSRVYDRAPLVVAMRRRGCIPVIDLFKDNVEALGRTQNDRAYDEEGGTAMHYFINKSLNIPLASNVIKRYAAILNQRLHVTMHATDDSFRFPSAIVDGFVQRASADFDAGAAELMAISLDLSPYVLYLEERERKMMPIAVDSVLRGLPLDAAYHVRRFVREDPRFVRIGAAAKELVFKNE